LSFSSNPAQPLSELPEIPRLRLNKDQLEELESVIEKSKDVAI
jgi:hypothetical protein